MLTEFRPYVSRNTYIPLREERLRYSEEWLYTVISLPIFDRKGLDSHRLAYVIILTPMSKPAPPSPEDAKAAALDAVGALHPQPDAVGDEAFSIHAFFDPRDRVQVRYEMLRRHHLEGRPVTEVARSFGVSRQTFYKMETAFEAKGIPGLLPGTRGPKRAHKCTDEVLDFVEQWRRSLPPEEGESVAEAVRHRFGVSIHPRSLDRALARRKKNGWPRGGRRDESFHSRSGLCTRSIRSITPRSPRAGLRRTPRTWTLAVSGARYACLA